MSLPACPKCQSEYTYEMGALLVCPECAHEWSASEGEATETAKVIRQIKELFASEAWAKFYNTADLDTLRHKIIHQLCFSALSLSEIKRNLLAHSYGK